MANKQVRAAIVGAPTMLGKELAEELNNSSAAGWDVRLLDESSEAETQLSASGEEAVLIQPLSAASLEGLDLVFFAGEPATTREHWRSLSKAGAAIVDLTGVLEGESHFLVRCPWLSTGAKPDLTTLGIVPAHPAATMLALVADRIGRRFALRSLAATVLEPASQGGRAALDELHQQTVGLLSFQSVPKEIFDSQVAFNLQGKLGSESRIELDAVRAVLRRQLALLLAPEALDRMHFTLVQAPVFHGYTISAFVELTAGVTEEQLRRALHGGVVLAEDDTEPSNLAATESSDLLISVQAEAAESQAAQGFWLWLAADNLRLAARNGVASAMELMALRPTDRVQ